MCTLFEEFSKCFDYFLKIAGFPDLTGKVFLIAFKFSLLIFQRVFVTGK